MSVLKPVGYVYQITNNINGKTYIGSHSGNNPKYMGSGVALKLAYKKYGQENFSKEIIMHTEHIHELETQILTVLDAANDPTMYNLINSGIGIRHTVETRNKISTGNTGKVRTGAALLNCQTANAGFTHTASYKERLSSRMQGNTYLLGHKHTSDTKAKLRAAILGVKRSPYVEHTCPHCGLTGRGGNLKRYHFDNCKHKPK